MALAIVGCLAVDVGIRCGQSRGSRRHGFVRAFFVVNLSPSVWSRTPPPAPPIKNCTLHNIDIALSLSVVDLNSIYLDSFVYFNMIGRREPSPLLFAMSLAIILAVQGVHSWCSPSIIIIRHAPSFRTTTRRSTPSTSFSNNPLLPVPSLLSSSSSSSSSSLGAGTNNYYDELQSQLPSMGLNELQTQFRQAIAREDMDAATLYRNELADRVSSGAYRANNDDDESTEEDAQRKRQRLSWAGLGTAPWLIERLQALEYPLPTTIQINAFEAVNAILSNNETAHRGGNNVNTNDDAEDTLEERMQSQTPQFMGVVISGSTGR